MNSSYIECISLSKQYKGRKQPVIAVSDVNLQIRKGEFILLRGRSGAGKSTLLSLVAGLIKPTSGSVRIDNDVITDLNNSSKSRLLSEKIGIIFQSLNLLPTYSIFENIEVALAPKGLSKQEILNLSLPLFKQFQLSDKLLLMPEELSMGQQQKVAIIRTLVKQPSVILADEPTASVDSETATEILDILQNLRKNGNITVILASHGLISDNLADRVLKLENGRIVN